jgi:hypothetical protein
MGNAVMAIDLDPKGFQLGGLKLKPGTGRVKEATLSRRTGLKSGTVRE